MGGRLTHSINYHPAITGVSDGAIVPYSTINNVRLHGIDIDIVNIDKLLAYKIVGYTPVVPLNNIHSTSNNELVTNEVNNGIYMLLFKLCNWYINATLQMVTDTCGVLRWTNGKSFEIAGTKYRVRNHYANYYKPMLLSNSKNGLLVQKESDPLDIREARLGLLYEKINLWDYDTDNKLILPHLFRLEVEGKLIHSK